MGKIAQAVRRLAGTSADMETAPGPAAVDLVRERLATAEGELPALHAALDAATLDAVLCTPETEQVTVDAREAARRALAAGEARVSDLRRALALVEERDRAAQSQAETDRVANAWRKVDTLAARRLALGAEIDTHAAALMAAVAAYADLGARIINAAPISVDWRSTGCAKGEPQHIARAQLHRHGMEGVFQWPWNVADIPSGASTAEKHNIVLRQYQKGQQ